MFDIDLMDELDYYQKPKPKKGVDQKVIIGVVALVFGLVGRFVPMINILFGSNRLILTDVALFGGLALIIVSVLQILLSLKKGEKKVEFERKLTWREKLANKIQDMQDKK